MEGLATGLEILCVCALHQFALRKWTLYEHKIHQTYYPNFEVYIPSHTPPDKPDPSSPPHLSSFLPSTAFIVTDCRRDLRHVERDDCDDDDSTLAKCRSDDLGLSLICLFVIGLESVWTQGRDMAILALF